MLEQPGFSREIDPRGGRRLPRLQLDPGAADDLRRGPQAARRATCSPGRTGESADARYARPGPVAGRARSRAGLGGRARRGAARGAARLDPRPPRRRRPGRGAALRRRRLRRASPRSPRGESGEPLKTFSIGFEEAGFDELARARLVAERYGTDHHELVLRPDAVELLPKLVEAFDEPFGDSSALPTYLVSELAAGEVKVALSGEGGDELFGGYYTYVADLLAPRVGRLAPLPRR